MSLKTSRSIGRSISRVSISVTDAAAAAAAAAVPVPAVELRSH